MLGGEAIGELARFGNGFGYKYRTLRSERLAGDLVVASLNFYFGCDGLREGLVAGDEDGERLGVVLGLRDEIGGDACGVAACRW